MLLCITAAGGVLTAKQAPPARHAPALGLRAGAMSSIVSQNQPGKGERIMSFHSWLQHPSAPSWSRAGANASTATGLTSSRDASAKPRSPRRPHAAQLSARSPTRGAATLCVVTPTSTGRPPRLAVANAGSNNVSISWQRRRHLRGRHGTMMPATTRKSLAVATSAATASSTS